MVACVSPAASNIGESKGTLQYAAHARNIKNKPIQNKDPISAQLAHLRNKIMELENDNKKLNNIISNNPELKKMLENINEGNKRLSLMRQSFDVQKSADNNKSLNDSKVKTKTEQNNLEQLRLTQKIEQDNIDLMNMQKQRDMLKLQLENARKEAENKEV